jgi:hypothetical protein
MPILLRVAALGGLAAVGLMLGACSHIPVMSMVTLARVDFETTDPAYLRAAVKMPANLKPRIGTLRAAVKIEGEAEKVEEFGLERVADAGEARSLRDEVENGMHITAYRLEPAEIARVSAFREALRGRRKEAASKGRRGSLTISVSPKACREGELPAKVLLTTYLRTTETGTYIPLARNVDMRTIDAEAGRDLKALIPPCD